MRKKVQFAWATFFGLGLLATIGWVFAHSAAPQASKTSAPGEVSCATTNCHTGNLNTGTGNATLVLGSNATTYTPGQLYVVTVTVTDPTMTRFGFQVTALANGTGATVGTFAVTNTVNTATQTATVTGFARRYISHKSANGNNTWTFNWTAPSSNVGTITFYLAGNATNNNNSSSGDKVYTRTFAFAATPPPAPVAAFTPNSTSICPGSSISFTDNSANQPSSWAWSFPGGNPSTSTLQNPTVSYAASGTYDVTLIATNATGSDTVVQSNVINVNALPQLAGTPTNVSCNAGSDGSINLTVSGTANNTYHWSNNSSLEDPSGLGAGSYSVTVTSSAGCTSTATYTVTQPSAITLTTSSTISNCGASTGTATVGAVGGTGNFTYLWTTGATTSTATGLASGSYTVTVTDQNACTATATVSVSNSGAPTGTTSFAAVTCNGNSDGSASVNVSGGQPPYAYAWSNSASTSAISGLSAGTYNVTVTDASQCQWVATVVVPEPAALQLTTTATPDNGGANGTATVTLTGGTPGYTYLWSNGQTTATATGLAAGSHNVTVTDANGCTSTASVQVVFMVGIAPKLSSNLFTVGPNPFSDYLLLRPSVPVMGKFVVHLVDIQGHIVFGTQLEGNGLSPIAMNTVSVSDGIYLLMIVSEEGKFLKKVIKHSR